MELSQAQEVEGLIERLVTSGKSTLDNVEMKRLKSLCKHSAVCLEHTFHILLSQLLKDHCEIRLSAFQIVNELFVRSHAFRTLLLNNFQQFMDCTIETDFDNPLPPPKLAADKLKEDSLRAIKRWHDKYGIAYQKLSLAFEYLKNVKKINFDNPLATIRNAALEQRLSRKKIVNGMLLDKLRKEVHENLWETQNIIAEISTCLKLLLPTFDEDELAVNPHIAENESNQESQSVLRETGIPERGYVIELDLSEVSNVRVTETADNEVVFDRIKELNKASTRIHLPRLRKWLASASKCEAPSDMIKSLIDVKIELQTALSKCGEMNVINDSSDEDVDDFIDVPETANSPSTSVEKQTKSKRKPQTVAKRSKDTNIWKPLKDTDSNDPTSYSYALAKQAQLQEKKAQDDLKTKQKKLQKITPAKKHTMKNDNNSNSESSLKEKAPFVSFGRDLLAWDAEKYRELKSNISLGAAKEFDVGHRFYGGNCASQTDSGVSEAVLSSITSRTIEFTGEYQPVLRSCKAPLPNGKLCPRQDRFKCPFHGEIIPRDACGNPVTSTVSDQPSTSSQSNDWNDPQFLQELESSLGPDVILSRKKKKTKKPEDGLTDLKKLKSTSRSRLQRKVLSKKSLKRVAETMNVLDAKRNLDKFGNNFNYALH